MVAAIVRTGTGRRVAPSGDDMVGQRTPGPVADGSSTGPPATVGDGMGQSINVVEKSGSAPGVARFELNRSLTSMAHLRYDQGDDISGARPPDELARRLLATGKVATVHMYSNVVTVELRPFQSTAGLIDVVRRLYTHYLEGVVPKKFD